MTYSSETEASIINAATKIFLQKGKNGARMQEIADKANLNKALLHYYFRSKERLYQEVFKRQIRHFLEELFGSVIEFENTRQLLEAFIDRYLEAISRRPELPRFIIWEIGEGGHLFGRTLTEMFAERGFAGIPLVEVLQKGMDEGQIRRTDPLQLVISLLGLLVYPFLAKPFLDQLHPELNIGSPEFLARRKTAVFDLLWHGIKPGGA